MTLQTTRKERLANGLCSECGLEPQGKNLNGSPSVRCEGCKLRLNREADESRGYLDSRPFSEYAVEVLEAIRAGNTSLAQIKAALGEKYKERWMFDSLDSLTGARLIYCTRDLYPQRWAVITEQRVREARKWNTTSNWEVQVKRPDSESLFSEAR